MDLVLTLPQRRIDRQADFGSGPGLVQIAQAAEAAGLSGITITDHPLVPLVWEANLGHHDLDPFVALAYLAAATKTLRLVTYLVVLPYRNPIPTAKALATLDLLFGGRLTVGVGAGYLEGEFEALGVPWAERNELTDEAIRVMVELWTKDEPTFAGRYSKFSGVRQLPHPVQKPHPPIWVGGNSKRAIRRAVELADGWAPARSSPSLAPSLHTAVLQTREDLVGRLAYAREIAEKTGRTRPLTLVAPGMFVKLGGTRGSNDGDSIVTSKDEVLEYLGAMRAIGASACGVSFPGRTVDELVENIARFGSEAAPAAPAI
jgi:probable F420-dependent oxidoreductase